MITSTPVPRSLIWEVTARCRLSCGHCYTPWSAPGATVPTELRAADRLAILERLVPHRRQLQALTLTGGEPLLLTDLEELLAAAHRLLPRVQLNVSTSGLLLNAERAGGLVAAGARVVQLTLLSARPEEHDRMVGQVGAHDRVLQAIAGARAAGLTVVVFFVAMRANIDWFAGVARLALALGAHAVRLNRFHPGGRGLGRWSELTPTAEQLQRAMAEVRELRRVAPIHLGTPLPPCELAGAGARRDVLRCPIGTRKASPAIGPDGRLRPCKHWPLDGGLETLLDRPLTELLASSIFSAGSQRTPPACTDRR